jgi:uncharacterized damage-inducible protein DinB
MNALRRPQAGDCHEYYFLYLNQVPEGSILEVLEAQLQQTLRLLARARDRADHRYAPGKWTIKEVVAHLIDVERAFAYRGLCFARGEPAALPDFDQDPYVERSGAQRRTLDDLAEEFELVRRSHLALFRSFDEEMAARRGIAAGREFTAGSIPFILAGHEIHHRKVLEGRYLTAAAG